MNPRRIGRSNTAVKRSVHARTYGNNGKIMDKGSVQYKETPFSLYQDDVILSLHSRSSLYNFC